MTKITSENNDRLRLQELEALDERRLLYAPERREIVTGVKISLNQMKLLQPDFSFQLQGREDVES